jgi:hopanoid-associated phosphorylase
VTVLAVVGLKREAAIIAGPQVIPVVAGNSGALHQRIRDALDPSVFGIISIGIAGALSPDLHAGEAVIAERVLTSNDAFETDAKWTGRIAAALRDAHIGAILGRSAIANTPDVKESLFKASGADAVDMESHIAAEVARENRLPFAALRVISDRADHALPPAALVAMTPNGGIALGRVLRSIALRPAQIPALMRTSRESEKAFTTLRRCRAALEPGLGAP